jgi:YesN/AraC family two-component response regulator
VEDNDDLRTFLYTILSHRYNILVAENGKVGLEKATAEQPDFIITDVTMPEMDGLTMVHQIKQNPDICHIPIVVLSAKASLEDRLQGLKEGIDDYITKPFSATYLRQRIENIIAQRSMLQRTWLGQLGGSENALSDNAHYTEETKAEAPQREYRLEAPEIVDTDQEMMEQLMQYLESHISDQDLKIEDMADAVNLGRTVFYGKIKSIVGMAPFDFLRHIRMQRAEDLISRSQMNISEVAYAVGFTDPKYFTKCFKKETGMTPTEYRDQKGMTEEL